MTDTSDTYNIERITSQIYHILVLLGALETDRADGEDAVSALVRVR